MRLAQLGVTEESQEIGSRREACGPMVLKLTNFLNHEILKKIGRSLGKSTCLLQDSKVDQRENSTGEGGERK